MSRTCAKPDFRRAVLDEIDANKGEIISYLKKLISVPSVTGDEGKIQEFISRKLSKMGLDVDTWEPDLTKLKRHPGYVPVDIGYEGRPNVVGKLKGKSGKSLLLNGHVDVIPADPKAWRHNPWRGEVVGDKLYGRGASDMKSGLAAMTMALDCVLKAGAEPKGDVTLEYVVDEERSGHGTLACVLKGYRADAGICCETSDLNVQPAAIGRIWFEIAVEGKPAGIASRWEGVDAIEKGYLVTQSVLELERARIDKIKHPLYPDNRGALPCSVGVFQSGTFPSALADNCLLKGSLATLPGEDSDMVKRQFLQHVMKAARKDPWLSSHLPVVKFTGYFAEPAEIPSSHPIVRTLAAEFKEVTGSEPTISGRKGAADTRFLIKYGKTPTVIFGPGNTAQMHATDEWVGVKDLITATKVLALSILSWGD